LVREVEFLYGGDFVDAAAPLLGVAIAFAFALLLLGALFDLRNEVTERARRTQRQPAPRLLLRHTPTTHARTHRQTHRGTEKEEKTRVILPF
jgi:hypothetical protein